MLDNDNLQDIWDFKTHPKLTIGNGKVFFHFNRKLCKNIIDKFVESIGIQNITKPEDVSQSTNGDQVACNVSQVEIKIMSVRSKFAWIQWPPFIAKDQRKLLGWIVHYREA